MIDVCHFPDGSTRIDIKTEEWTGYAITDKRGPLQLMHRVFGRLSVGDPGVVCWLRPSVGPWFVPAEFALFCNAISYEGIVGND